MKTNVSHLSERGISQRPTASKIYCKCPLITHWHNTSLDVRWIPCQTADSVQRSASTSVTTSAIGSVISPRPQEVLPCLSVTLSNIILLLIYLAASRCYSTCRDRRLKTIINSRNMTRARISTTSRRLQNIL